MNGLYLTSEVCKFFYASILLISILFFELGDNLCRGFGKVSLTLINSLSFWLSEEVFFPLYFLEIELLNIIFLAKVFSSRVVNILHYSLFARKVSAVKRNSHTGEANFYFPYYKYVIKKHLIIVLHQDTWWLQKIFFWSLNVTIRPQICQKKKNWPWASNFKTVKNKCLVHAVCPICRETWKRTIFSKDRNDLLYSIGIPKPDSSKSTFMF